MHPHNCNTTLPIHYYGPVPIQNQTTDAFTLANHLDHLRDAYTAQWLAGIDPAITETLTKHNIAYWNSVQNDTTPYYRTGSGKYYT